MRGRWRPGSRSGKSRDPRARQTSKSTLIACVSHCRRFFPLLCSKGIRYDAFGVFLRHYQIVDDTNYQDFLDMTSLSAGESLIPQSSRLRAAALLPLIAAHRICMQVSFSRNSERRKSSSEPGTSGLCARKSAGRGRRQGRQRPATTRNRPGTDKNPRSQGKGRETKKAKNRPRRSACIASRCVRHGKVYIGCTGNYQRRIAQHKHKPLKCMRTDVEKFSPWDDNFRAEIGAPLAVQGRCEGVGKKSGQRNERAGLYNIMDGHPTNTNLYWAIRRKNGFAK
jgi:hypothetical protein